jgi:hypothetical protein
MFLLAKVSISTQTNVIPTISTAYRWYHQGVLYILCK